MTDQSSLLRQTETAGRDQGNWKSFGLMDLTLALTVGQGDLSNIVRYYTALLKKHRRCVLLLVQYKATLREVLATRIHVYFGAYQERFTYESKTHDFLFRINLSIPILCRLLVVVVQEIRNGWR